MGKLYKNPPVIEALCEFFFKGVKWDHEIPFIFYDKVKNEYPFISQASRIVQSNNKRNIEILRTLFIKEDGSAELQIAPNLLVYNQLRPYPKFEEWKPKAFEALSLYEKLCRPEEMCKIGLRYINQITIPREIVLLEDYFLLYPRLPELISKADGRFSMSLEIPLQGGHCVIVTLGSIQPDKPYSYNYILDIYDFVSSPIPLENEKIDNLIIQAHDNIQKIFENSITNKLRELFGEIK